MNPTELNVLRAQMAATMYSFAFERLPHSPAGYAVECANDILFQCGITADEPAPAEPAKALAEPDGYAYEYAEGIRFTGGCEYNGRKPKRAVPYWFAPPPPAEPAKPEPDYRTLLKDLVEALREEGFCMWRNRTREVWSKAVIAVAAVRP